ncbi:hypothetical protein HanXRQr2_Chr02g0081151 [Helianthus annuus]|uniref:Uncharacterized protein n=1 Tax=Helianthus annuus TaxID=4232 RepID=A0A9K3P0Q0_HELAN|nr:hypothetical protein HanXRQr2_Chr02g0081151 [Helianthus annuus]KAJ0952983.1 hypothetical protein HanPSC8_Chr02g0078651 [Helianthus annuus]
MSVLIQLLIVGSITILQIIIVIIITPVDLIDFRLLPLPVPLLDFSTSFFTTFPNGAKMFSTF